MRARHPLLGLAIAAAAALPAAASAQSGGTTVYAGPMRQGWWGRTSLGLSVNRSALRLPCPAFNATCEEVSVVGTASVGNTPLNLFTRLGSTSTVKTYALGADGGSGLAYGAGLSWDFSPRASATVAWDSYDLRGSTVVRTTSLGLQWRY